LATPYLGEIRIFSFGFPPNGWALCDGQLLPIVQNTALFSLLGTIYGGNGINSFALPNLQGRVPLHFNNTTILQGQTGGSPTVTLNTTQMPAHAHPMLASVDIGTTNVPDGNVLAARGRGGPNIWAPATPLVAMGSTDSVGGLPHDNKQPTLTLNFCIALAGIFPSRA
jgi:microcystin-dependent protein